MCPLDALSAIGLVSLIKRSMPWRERREKGRERKSPPSPNGDALGKGLARILQTESFHPWTLPQLDRNAEILLLFKVPKCVVSLLGQPIPLFPS